MDWCPKHGYFDGECGGCMKTAQDVLGEENDALAKSLDESLEREKALEADLAEEAELRIVAGKMDYEEHDRLKARLEEAERERDDLQRLLDTPRGKRRWLTEDEFARCLAESARADALQAAGDELAEVVAALSGAYDGERSRVVWLSERAGAAVARWREIRESEERDG